MKLLKIKKMNYFKNSTYPKRKIFFFILLAPVLFFGIGAIVMLLWNAILPAIIHVETINFWQAIGLLLLSKILFSGFRHGYSHRHPYSHSKHSYLRDKWLNMSDEEKAKFKENWKNCCHSDEKVSS
jgi:hypothetical protein